MDNQKVGNFIANLRKEKNLTQKDLAEKLNITDRAISKWENGRGMPDISLLKPLCDELNISVNELLCGEIINNEEIKEKSDENIINTLNSSKKERKNLLIAIVASVLIILTVFISAITIFLIDINRMNNNEEVLFSTWGFKYANPVNIDDKKWLLK